MRSTPENRPKPAYKVVAPADAEKNRRMVYLRNLSYRRDRAGVRRLCEPYGQVGYVKVLVDPVTQESQGMAFVEMGSPEEARKAMQGLNNQVIDGRTLKAAPAIPQKRALMPVAEEREPKREDKRKVPRDVAPPPKNKRVGNLHKLNEYLARKGRMPVTGA